LPGKDLISLLLKLNPAERVSAEEALQHPWFKVSRSTPKLTRRNLRNSISFFPFSSSPEICSCMKSEPVPDRRFCNGRLERKEERMKERMKKRKTKGRTKSEETKMEKRNEKKKKTRKSLG